MKLATHLCAVRWLGVGAAVQPSLRLLVGSWYQIIRSKRLSDCSLQQDWSVMPNPTRQLGSSPRSGVDWPPDRVNLRDGHGG